MSILEWIKILKDLNKNELNNLELLCQERFIKKGDILFNQWEEATSMYILKQWEIEISTYKNNQEVTLGYIKAEDILWEMAIFWDKNKRMASAIANIDTVVIVILKFAIQELTKNHPKILEKIKSIIDTRINKNTI